LKNKRDKH